MASTRNKNTFGNYCLEKKQNADIEQWKLYAHGANGTAYDTKFSGNGLNPGRMPTHTLSHNPADIESFLFGINSTNLVTPAGPLTPELKHLQTAHLFNKSPVIMPVPQAVPKYQRPFPT
jgi:hypothetical protein